jgi:hypothetical protein
MKLVTIRCWVAVVLQTLLAILGHAEEFKASARTEIAYYLEEPLHGFTAVFVRETNDAMTNRFGSYWVMNLLNHADDLEYPSRQFMSAFNGAVGDSLREYLVEDPETQLLVVAWFEEKLESLTSGKVARFVLKTLVGDQDENQLTSPFGQERRPPIQAVNFSTHKVNFGLRPFSDDNPSVFLGYTMKIGDVEALNVQARVHFENWEKPIPEVIIRIPIDSWSIGAGFRLEDGNSLQTNDRTWQSEQGTAFGVRYFVGVQGPLLGGWFLISTGYPVPLTVLYCRRF